VESGSIVKIVRTEDTFLLLIGEAIASQIDDLEKTLPKNDCSQYARVASRNARVTPPTFSISMVVEGSAWVCSKIPPYPCKSSRELPAETLTAGLRAADDDADALHSDDFSNMRIPVQFGDFNPFRPPSPFNPPPNPFNPSQPIHPPVKSPVKMCDQLKTKLGGGTVAVDYILAGQVQGNAPSISISKNINPKLDKQATFVLGLLGGPSLGWIAKLELEKKLKGIISEKSRFIPDSISLPQGPREPLVWQTKSTQFAAKPYNNQVTPALVVVREIQTKQSTACYLRDQFKSLH
jgi:hypothetical protein